MFDGCLMDNLNLFYLKIFIFVDFHLELSFPYIARPGRESREDIDKLELLSRVHALAVIVHHLEANKCTLQDLLTYVNVF